MELVSIKEAMQLLNASYYSVRYYVKTKKIIQLGNKISLQSINDFLYSQQINDLPNEVWKSAKGFSRYLCSNFGRIKSTKYRGHKKDGLINQAISGGYYKSVYFDDNGKYNSINSHRLICLAFYPNEDYKILEVNHKDGNKLNNNIDNLEWCTRQENIKHCIENNLQYVLKGEEIGNSILKEHQVLEIRTKHIPRKYTIQMIADEYGVKHGTIKNLLLGNTWKHI